MPADAHDAPPADWYLDPEDPARGRYWDGAAWTSDVVDVPEGLTLATFPRTAQRRQRQSRRRALLVAAAVVALVASVGVAGWWAGSGTEGDARVAGAASIRLRGSVDLEDPSFIGRERGAPCSGEGGVADVTAGLAVTVRSADGTVVAAARLRAGRLVATASDLPDDLGELIPTCRLPFECEVPEGSTYQIGVEGHGNQTWSREELESSGWTARLSITG